MSQRDLIISDMDIGNPEDDGLFWMPAKEVSGIACEAVESVWPGAEWSMDGGQIRISTSQLLDEYNAGPVIAWRAEQMWELIGRVIRGRMVADICEHPTTTFGARLRGYRCNRPQVPVIATIGVLSIAREAGGGIDEMIGRFLRRFDMPLDNDRA